ncbi:hypothetical protein CUJ83_13725 [Methanocella sp. CWC-04]|uniref:Glycosyltransferase 2-like domain-containing protein n=1 Tax=Methanooceanicella nereidis TaxID=2052831 RepID=A0AAP2REX1_9EURY|nr:glycosyltransferase [Methanocella sp. CWC-04]MCD1296058.1 hypothetical protein [Methanocella sp. CWC-04]
MDSIIFNLMNYIYYIMLIIIYLCIAYSFVFYTTSLQHREKPSRDIEDSYYPGITIIASVFNEADIIETKLKNLSDIIYPSDRLEVLIVDGNSPDGTGDIVSRWIKDNNADNFRLLIQRDNKGKIDALNIGLRAASHELIMVTDADTELVPGVLKSTAKYFADPCVGAVGPWILPKELDGFVPNMEMSFWITNNKMRTLESRISSSSLVAGCYMFRRSLQRSYPANVVADDFYTALNISSQGYDVIYLAQVMGSEIRTPHDLRTWMTHKLRKGIANLQTVMMFRDRFSISNKRSFIYYNKVMQHILAPIAFACFMILHIYYALYSVNVLNYFSYVYDMSSLYSWYLFMTNLPYVIWVILAADVLLAFGAVYSNRSAKRRIPRGNVDSKKSSVVLVAIAAIFSQFILLAAIVGLLMYSPSSKYKRIS